MIRNLAGVLIGSALLSMSAWSGRSVAAAGCDGDAAVLAAYRSASPLLATDPEAVLRISVHADGCVVTQRPAHFTQPGIARQRLAPDALASLRRHLAAPELLRFDPASLRQKQARALAAKAEASTRYRVFDEDIIEIDLHPALAPAAMKARTRVHWTSLQGDLLNFPDDPTLLALAAAQQALLELAQPSAAVVSP